MSTTAQAAQALKRLLTQAERGLSVARKRRRRAVGTRVGQPVGSNRVRLTRATGEVEQATRHVEEAREQLAEP